MAPISRFVRVYRWRMTRPAQEVGSESQPDGCAVFDSPYALSPRASVSKPSTDKPVSLTSFKMDEVYIAPPLEVDGIRADINQDRLQFSNHGPHSIETPSESGHETHSHVSNDSKLTRKPPQNPFASK